MKYKILMMEGGAGIGTTEVEVDGEPVHFPGFEAFTFFSHSSVVNDFWGSFDDHRITELSSGCSIGGGFTLEEAMTKANEQLSMSSPEQLQKLIDNALKVKMS